MDSDKRVCSNCEGPTKLSHALVVQQGGRVIAVVCDTCQKAQKVQITFAKSDRGSWDFFQYFPLEG